MPAITTAIAVAGLVTAGVGAYGQQQAGQKAAKASQRAESIRQESARVEAVRRQREVIRQSIIARAAATSRAANRGALTSSSITSGTLSLESQAGSQVGQVNTNLALGNQIFDANRAEASARSDGATWSAIGQFGGALMSNSQTIGNFLQPSTAAAPTLTGWDATVTPAGN